MTTPEFALAALPTTGADGGDNDRVVAAIEGWINSTAMTALLTAFGHEPSTEGPLATRLDELERFSTAHWDFRGGAERHLARRVTFTPDRDALIRAASTALGLTGRRVPTGRVYDHLLVLGGGVRTAVARAELAAELLRGGVRTGTVAGLGSMRPLTGQDKAARDLGLRPCPREGDAVDEGLRRAFALGDPTGRRGGTTAQEQDWWVRSYVDREPVVHVLAAPSTRPGQRANTADTLTGWAELVQPSPHGARLLLVTTDLFVPFQHCDAVRLLGLTYGCSVETVGFDTVSGGWAPPSGTDALLQEVRSAVRSMQGLHRALHAD